MGARNSYSSFRNHETLWNAGAFAASLSQNHLLQAHDTALNFRFRNETLQSRGGRDHRTGEAAPLSVWSVYRGLRPILVFRKRLDGQSCTTIRSRLSSLSASLRSLQLSPCLSR